jgi:hypothetical protein
MENHLGRYLEQNEVVHHIDGDRSNNHINNLKLTNQSDHAKEHSTKLNPIICPQCKKEFKPTQSKIKYCSIECAHQASRKIKRPSKEHLIELVSSLPMTRIGEMYNVSDNTIRKWCRYYGIRK